MCSRGARERECLKGSASAVEEEWLDGVFVCEGESWKERSWFDTTIECVRLPRRTTILPRLGQASGQHRDDAREVPFSFLFLFTGFLCVCVWCGGLVR